MLAACFGVVKVQDIKDDYEDLTPFSGQKFELFDWQLCTSIAEKEPGNVIISPISIKFLLNMLYEGSVGPTARELEKVLQLPKSKSTTRLRTSTILRSLQAPSPQWELDIGTKIYIDRSLSPKNWFQRVLFLYYDAYIEKMNFADHKTSANRINRWVEMITHRHIKNMIPEGESLDQTVLLMLNAIYFKGTWKNLFSEADTYSGPFETPNGLKDVRYMSQSNHFYYMRSEILNSQILRLPYLGHKFAMYIVLPDTTDGLDVLIKTLDPATLRKQIWMLEETSVYVTLPKFKFRYTSNLKDTLQNLGLKTIFESYGDMRGIINNKNKTLVVSNVIQKAGIEVNEEGSVVTAATEMQFVNKFGGLEESFNASHPFLFFIEDETTGAIVFVGKYVTPEEEVEPEKPPSTSHPLAIKFKKLDHRSPIPKWYQFKEKNKLEAQLSPRQMTSQLL